MLNILKEADGKKKSRGGRNKNNLCLEDQLLMALDTFESTGRIFTSVRVMEK